MVQRSLRMAADADLERVEAKYDNGVLQLTVPRIKRPEYQAKRIEVL